MMDQRPIALQREYGNRRVLVGAEHYKPGVNIITLLVTFYQVSSGEFH